MRYAEIYERAMRDPDGFWMEAAEGIDWVTPPSKALCADHAPLYEWFADGTLNACWNAVDRHVEAGHGERLAIIHDSPLTGTTHKITYTELQTRVASLAGALKAKGVGKGDRVIIYMPMVPEALEAMLACARLGAIHSVVFGGFAANELAVRIDDCTPKCIIAASCGLEPGRVVHYKPLLDGALAIAKHQPEFCVIFQREQEVAKLEEGRDHDWHGFQYGVTPADCVPVEGNHPAYILYTSGTTGQPKGVIRHTGGHLVALNWSMRNLYDMNPGEVFWAASDVGWVVGHSYICYAPLTFGCTTIVFEGKPVGTPDAGTFWRVIQDHKVKSLFTAPTAFRAIKRDDPAGALVGDYDLSSLESLFLAGERADPDTIVWAQDKLGVPVIDHWWQTETGWAIAGNPLGIEKLPVKIGSPSVAMPGYDVRILDEAGHPVAAGTLGAIAIKLPLPPGTLPNLWQAEERFRKSYLGHFPGYYETGDAGMIDADGYLYIMARTDDVINVAGHRLSTGAMEEVLASHPDVAECAVIGVADTLKGQLPMGFLCLNKGAATASDQVVKDCVKLVRDRIGPVAA
ncbi:AMP-binding protein, partial [Roseicyclus sp.]|uniref:AMP-binding protein n=1 Tax=Roseicyclus sp. TaxID=1914329 RepID=UPI003F6CB58B